jgi:hypothetical protein
VSKRDRYLACSLDANGLTRKREEEMSMKQHMWSGAGALALMGTLACSNQNPTQPDRVAAQPNAAATAAAQAVSRPTARNSEQVVFSGVASTGSTFGSPVGFWIWCEADSTNPYAGECNGAMYFYALGITKHVDDSATILELSEGVYKITVASTKDSSIACTLQNSAAPVRGPNNTVTVTCSAPASGSATSNTAVVNVTGP